LQRTLARQDKLSLTGLRLADAVHRLGHPLTPELARQRERDLEVSAIIRDLKASKPPRPPKDIAAVLNTVPTAILSLRLRAIVDALLAAPSDRAIAVLCAAARARFKDIGTELEQRWPRPGRPPSTDQARAAGLTFGVTARPQGKQQTADFGVLRNLLGQCVTALGKDERAAVFRAVPHELRDEWARWLREVEPSRIKRGLSRMTGGRLGESGKAEG
jgi:hypothetical protein